MDSPFQIFLFYENTNRNLTVLSTSDTQLFFLIIWIPIRGLMLPTTSDINFPTRALTMYRMRRGVIVGHHKTFMPHLLALVPHSIRVLAS